MKKRKRPKRDRERDWSDAKSDEEIQAQDEVEEDEDGERFEPLGDSDEPDSDDESDRSQRKKREKERIGTLAAAMAEKMLEDDGWVRSTSKEDPPDQPQPPSVRDSETSDLDQEPDQSPQKKREKERIRLMAAKMAARMLASKSNKWVRRSVAEEQPTSSLRQPITAALDPVVPLPTPPQLVSLTDQPQPESPSPSSPQPLQIYDASTLKRVTVADTTKGIVVEGWLVRICVGCGAAIVAHPLPSKAPASPPPPPPTEIKIAKSKPGWKICPKCGTLVGTKASKCSCGHLWSVKTKRAGEVRRSKLPKGKKRCPDCGTIVGTRTKRCPAKHCGWRFDRRHQDDPVSSYWHD